MKTSRDTSIATHVYARIAADLVRACASLALLWLTAVPAGAQAGRPVPCCSITAIGARTGIVTAKENSTGRMFEFKVADEKLLQSLKVGEGVYANYSSGQVSVDGAHPCCNIVSLDPPPPVNINQGGTLNPAPASCGI